MDENQKEYYLREQLKVIQGELGIDSGDDAADFMERIERAKLPLHVEKKLMKEVSRLAKTPFGSPEATVSRGYIETCLEIPWKSYTKDRVDLKRAETILNRDHDGLEKVKERIIEYLAVLKLKGDMKSPIICLYGPPGVGKTSLGKSVAKALGRKYVRIALGGVHDESEIRGHRKTYVGALPGRILNGINRAGTSNPVIVLDEVDKLTKDIKGDPSSALLEALDPEQNTAFHDGGEAMALKFKLPVYFAHSKRIAPGRYEIRFDEIYDGKEEVAPHEITERYVEKLESMIMECPELWMWSHRRWKQTPERQTLRFGKNTLQEQG